jgi:hypothetical protein
VVVFAVACSINRPASSPGHSATNKAALAAGTFHSIKPCDE